MALCVLVQGCALSFDEFDPVAPDAGLLCPPGFWESEPPTDTTVQICERLTECSDSEYESSPPARTSDRVCTALTVCPPGTYDVVPATATSDRECSYLSCQDLLLREPGTPDGMYVVDPDGPEGAPPITVTCDMDFMGGGWTVITLEDFESGADGWSDPRTSTCGTVTVLGGPNGFGAGAASQRTYGLSGIPHTEARLALQYFRFDSWDNELAIVRIDGADVFVMASGGFACATSEPSQAFVVDVVVPHTADAATVQVASTLDEPSDNESFGVDQVELYIR